MVEQFTSVNRLYGRTGRRVRSTVRTARSLAVPYGDVLPRYNGSACVLPHTEPVLGTPYVTSYGATGTVQSDAYLRIGQTLFVKVNYLRTQ